jgi:hypothetical protein
MIIISARESLRCRRERPASHLSPHNGGKELVQFPDPPVPGAFIHERGLETVSAFGIRQRMAGSSSWGIEARSMVFSLLGSAIEACGWSFESAAAGRNRWNRRSLRLTFIARKV